MAVGRALRTAGRPAGGGHRGALPRPVGPAPLRRGGPPDGGRPGDERWPSPAAGDPVPAATAVEFIGNYTAFHDLLEPAVTGRPRCADRGGGLPRPPRHLRRRRQRGGAGPAGGLAGDRRRVWSRPPPTPAARRPTSTAWAGVRTAPRCGRPRPSEPTARWPAAVDRGRWCWRCAPGTRSSGRRFPEPTADRCPGSGCSTSRRRRATGRRAVGRGRGSTPPVRRRPGRCHR